MVSCFLRFLPAHFGVPKYKRRATMKGCKKWGIRDFLMLMAVALHENPPVQHCQGMLVQDSENNRIGEEQEKSLDKRMQGCE